MRRLLNALRPHPTIPITPWRAANQWDLSLTRLLILFSGLFVFGIGDSLLIVSGLGNAPWSVLAQGISKQSSLSIGFSTLLVSTLVLALWIPLKERPGFGTIANIAIIAIAIDLGINFFPSQNLIVGQLFYVLTGILLVGIGSAFYITCGLGPGPRDGWMTAIHRRSGIPIGRVRLGIEIVVLSVGWKLGGRVGIGTALFAALVGYSVALFFGVVSRLTHR